MSETNVVDAPAYDPNNFRYQGSCQDALRPAFEQLYRDAIAAGWVGREVTYALMVLAAAAIKHEGG